MSVHHKVSDVMITNQNLERLWFLDIINVLIKSAVGSSEDVAACYDRASAIGCHVSWRHQAHLEKFSIFILKYSSHYFSLTCHGYLFSSVSTPPTILVLLLGSPQLHTSLEVEAVVEEKVVSVEVAVAVEGVVEGETENRIQ